MMRGHKHLIACLFALSLWLPAQSYAATDFDDDFEYANNATMFSSGWVSGNCNAGGIIEVSSDRAFTGTKSLKYYYVGANPPVTCWMDRSYPVKTHIFTREYLYLSPGFHSVSGVPTKHTFQGGSTTGPDIGYPNTWIGIYDDSTRLGYNWQGTGGDGTNDNPVKDGLIPTGVWTCVETEVNMNTPDVANGVYRAWKDGVLVLERTNHIFRRANNFNIGNPPVSINTSAGDFSSTRLYRQHGVAGTTIYVDRYAVGSTRIGCVGAPPTPDTIPPQPPTNLVGNAGSSTLTWTAGSDTGGSGLAGVQVFRCTRNPGDCTPTTLHTTVNAPATSYVDTLAQPGFTYDYKLRSVDGGGLTSTFTSEVSLTIPSTTRRALFTDTFVRADNADAGTNYTGGYTAGFSFKIASNRLAPSTVDNNNLERYNVAIPNDQWAMVQVSDSVSASENVHVGTRTSAGPTWNGMECSIIGLTTGRVSRRDAGVRTDLDSRTLSVAFQIGDRLRGESQGTTHRCYVIRTSGQGVQTEELVGTATDATYASGSASVRVSTVGLPGTRISELVVGDFTGVVDDSITHDATSVSAAANVTNSITWSHTVGSGQNRLLTVCTQTRDATAPITTTAVTANGIGLLKFQEDSRVVAGNNLYTSLWRQVAPNSGSNTIVATFSGAPASYAVGTASSWAGVQQVNPVDAMGGANGTGTAISLPITTASTNTLIVDCVLGQAALTASGQTIRSNRTTTVGADGAMTSSKAAASAGATTMTSTQATATNWVGSTIALKAAQVEAAPRPKIVSGSLSPTGAAVMYDVTPPTALRVTHGKNSGFNVQQVDIPIASVPAGVVSLTWPAGDEFATIVAIDALGGANQTNLEYFAGDLVGIAPPGTLNPVVMTNPQPSTQLPAGTIAATISMTVDQVALARECRWSDTDQSYDAMPTANQMTVNGTFASGTKTGLSNGNSYTPYRTCIIVDDSGTVIESPARSSSTFTVATTTADVTPPGNVSNLSCVASGTQATCTWTVPVDAVSYELYYSNGACATYTTAATPSGTTHTLMGLVQNTIHCVKVKAVDVVGNLSAVDSNIQTFFIGILTDPFPPSNLSGMRVTAYQRSILVEHDACTDSVSAAAPVIEYCVGGSCTPGESAATNFGSPVLIPNLTPGTVYRLQGYCTDGTNASLQKTSVFEVTTRTTGLDAPRLPVQFGVTRPSATRQAVGARIIRPPY